MKLTKQVDEAKNLLDQAIEDLSDEDAKIQALPDDVDDKEHDFHMARFKQLQADVRRRTQTLERLVAIQEARENIPALSDDGDDDDDDDAGRSASRGVKGARGVARLGLNGGGGGRLRVKESLVYEARSEHSYFRDLVFAEVERDEEARGRLMQHGRQMIVESRDVTTGDPGAASFIPPLYMGADWIDTATPGRRFADAIPKIPLSPVGKRMDFPRVQVAPTTDVQVAEADAVNEVDFDGETYSVNKVTIAGQNDVSIQTLEFTDPSIDTVIMRELVKSYNSKLDYQLIYGTGSNGQHRGIKTVVVSDGGNTRSFSSGNAAALLGQLYGAQADISTQAPGYEAQTVLLHSRRAAWMASHRDANGNLFQQGQLFLAAGEQNRGFVGNVAGLNVIRDANIATTQGTGTNEDDLYVMDIEELMLAEGPLRTRVLQEVLSGTLQIRIQLFAFSAFAGGRRPKVLTRISGAGLATPTFPSS